jgi:anti-sigma regulatory factor (Ser/Thr protein kinase)
MASRRFEPEPRSLHEARVFIRENTRGSARAEDVELAASELATNVIRHAQTPWQLSVDLDPKQVRLEVTDASPMMPTLSQSSRRRHGLGIVASVAERWGVERLDGGKTVWAEFDQ